MHDEATRRRIVRGIDDVSIGGNASSDRMGDSDIDESLRGDSPSDFPNSDTEEDGNTS